MKFIKMLSLLAVAAAAMMAFASAASADVATAPTGTTYTGKIHATSENGHASLHGSNGVTIECASTVEGTITGHGAGKPVTGTISTLNFTGCTGGYIVHVNKAGTLSASATSGGNATVTSNGAEVTVTAPTIFGTITCIYTTANTHIGTLTAHNNATTPNHATLDITGTIPRTGGSSLCGSSGLWTGSYKVNTPTNFAIDKT